MKLPFDLPHERIINRVNNASLKAWARLTEGNPELASDIESMNAFFHVYSAALLTKDYGAGHAQMLGDLKEGNTWKDAKIYPEQRRDTYKDYYNNQIGIQMAEGRSRSDLEDAALDAVTNGLAIVRTRKEGADYRIPLDITDKSKPGMLSAEASGAARDYYRTWGNASGQPYQSVDEQEQALTRAPLPLGDPIPARNRPRH